MKVKTSELTGPTLDWAVAKCDGKNADCEIHASNVLYGRATSGFVQYHPSTNWSQGGPIIEREKIDTAYTIDGWYANMYWRGQDNTVGAGDSYRCGGDGPTALIAAMRCFVASKFGEELEVPDELA